MFLLRFRTHDGSFNNDILGGTVVRHSGYHYQTRLWGGARREGPEGIRLRSRQAKHHLGLVRQKLRPLPDGAPWRAIRKLRQPRRMLRQAVPKSASKWKVRNMSRHTIAAKVCRSRSGRARPDTAVAQRHISPDFSTQTCDRVIFNSGNFDDLAQRQLFQSGGVVRVSCKNKGARSDDQGTRAASGR